MTGVAAQLDAETVLAAIDKRAGEMLELTRSLAAAYSPPGREETAAAILAGWLEDAGIPFETYARAPSRPSIVATLAGERPESSTSLLFNSHLDTPISREDDHLRLRDPHHPRYTTSWIEGERVYGYGAVNDKGPMAAWLIAAKALKETVAPLPGNLYLTAVSGEIGQSPVDELQGPRYEGTGYGARELVEAGIRADYALVAEATGFTAAWVELGKANFKITVHAGPSRYTPHIPRPLPLAENPNAIVRSAPLLLALEEWGDRYRSEQTRHCNGVLVAPNVNVGAIRSGVRYNLERTPEVCFLYIDVRTLPDADPEPIRQSLEALLDAQGIDGIVELFAYHSGAESPNVAPLLDAIRRAHANEFGRPMEGAAPVMSSMWRDTIPFAQAEIPSITYGPSFPTGGRNEYFLERDELVAAARVYARLALDLCCRAKEA